MKFQLLANYKSSFGGLREGKGGALLGLAFFSQPQKAGAGDRPVGARPNRKNLENFVDNVFDGDAFGVCFVVFDNSVAQDSGGYCFDVFDVWREFSVEGGVCFGG